MSCYDSSKEGNQIESSTIFYSWQSESKKTKHFIDKALSGANEDIEEGGELKSIYPQPLQTLIDDSKYLNVTLLLLPETRPLTSAKHRYHRIYRLLWSRFRLLNIARFLR